MNISYEKLSRKEVIQKIESLENNFDDISMYDLFDELILIALRIDEPFPFQEGFQNVSRDLLYAKSLNDKSRQVRGSIYLKGK